MSPRPSIGRLSLLLIAVAWLAPLRSTARAASCQSWHVLPVRGFPLLDGRVRAGAGLLRTRP